MDEAAAFEAGPRSEEKRAMKVLVPVKRVIDYNVKVRVKADMGLAWIWPM